MRRRLFLTGPIGCGKSTAIRTALGDNLFRCGGFLTQRYLEPHLHFNLESPDGSIKQTFLNFEAGKPNIDQRVFSNISWEGRILVLDEIGGIELLNADFTAALDAVLECNTPILGVLKGTGPAGSLIEALKLTREYETAASQLRQRLCSDPDTLVYECKQFDENALNLAKQWAAEYLHT